MKTYDITYTFAGTWCRRTRCISSVPNAATAREIFMLGHFGRRSKTDIIIESIEEVA